MQSGVSCCHEFPALRALRSRVLALTAIRQFVFYACPTETFHLQKFSFSVLICYAVITISVDAPIDRYDSMGSFVSTEKCRSIFY